MIGHNADAYQAWLPPPEPISNLPIMITYQYQALTSVATSPLGMSDLVAGYYATQAMDLQPLSAYYETFSNANQGQVQLMNDAAFEAPTTKLLDILTAQVTIHTSSGLETLSLELCLLVPHLRL